MENAVGQTSNAAIADREIAVLIDRAHNLQIRLSEANNNIQSIERRLFPQHPESAKEATDAPEAVRSELEQLGYLLNQINEEITRSFELANALDRI